MSTTKLSRSDPEHMARKEEARQRFLASLTPEKRAAIETKSSAPTIKKQPIVQEEKEAPRQPICWAGPFQSTTHHSFITKMHPVSPRKRVGDRDAQFLHALEDEDVAICAQHRKGSALEQQIQQHGFAHSKAQFHDARKVIQSKIVDHIEDGDVILIHSESDIFMTAFCQAKTAGKSFRVVVCENKPFETRTVKALARADVDCTAIVLTAVAYMMQDITKVFLTSDVIQPESIIAKQGAGMIAVVAHMNEKPLCLFYETFKEVQSRDVPSDIVGKDTPYDVIPRSFFTELTHE